MIHKSIISSQNRLFWTAIAETIIRLFDWHKNQSSNIYIMCWPVFFKQQWADFTGWSLSNVNIDCLLKYWSDKISNMIYSKSGKSAGLISADPQHVRGGLHFGRRNISAEKRQIRPELVSKQWVLLITVKCLLVSLISLPRKARTRVFREIRRFLRPEANISACFPLNKQFDER